jgi:hypothetical protein
MKKNIAREITKATETLERRIAELETKQRASCKRTLNGEVRLNMLTAKPRENGRAELRAQLMEGGGTGELRDLQASLCEDKISISIFTEWDSDEPSGCGRPSRTTGHALT